MIDTEQPPLSEEQVAALRQKWNTPNWKIAAEYNYISNLTNSQIRWEFLRREANYRNFWQFCVASPIAGYSLDVVIDPAIRADALPNDFRFNNENMRGGLMEFSHPSIKNLLEVPYDRQDHYLNTWYGKQLRDVMECGYSILAFDPNYSIPSQLKRAKEALDKRVEKLKLENPDEVFMERLHIPRDANTLLRVIDADNETIGLHEIGQRIYGIEDDNEAELIARERLKNARSYWKKL